MQSTVQFTKDIVWRSSRDVESTPNIDLAHQQFRQSKALFKPANRKQGSKERIKPLPAARPMSVAANKNELNTAIIIPRNLPAGIDFDVSCIRMQRTSRNACGVINRDLFLVTFSSYFR